LTRYTIPARSAIVAGLLSTAALVLLPSSGSATLVCPPGTKNPAYCINVPPTATTGTASDIGTTTATFNGVSGPGVSAGDITHYYFQYGRTTAYGSQTPTGTVGVCPPGLAGGPYCSVPLTQLVSATVTGLTQGQTYHYRIISTSPDGTTAGQDESFTTHSVTPPRPHPIKSVKSPARVKAGNTFTVVVALNLRSKVVITLRFKGAVVRISNVGFKTGTFRQKIKAPAKKGAYTLRVRATAAKANTQIVNRGITIT
jgi:hypothetical protein